MMLNIWPVYMSSRNVCRPLCDRTVKVYTQVNFVVVNIVTQVRKLVLQIILVNNVENICWKKVILQHFWTTLY